MDGRKNSSRPGFGPGPSSPVAQSLYRLSYRAHKPPQVVDINYLSHNKVESGRLCESSNEPSRCAKSCERDQSNDHWSSISRRSSWLVIYPVCVWREHCGLCLTTTFVVKWWRVRTLIGFSWFIHVEWHTLVSENGSNIYMLFVKTWRVAINTFGDRNSVNVYSAHHN